MVIWKMELFGMQMLGNKSRLNVTYVACSDPKINSVLKLALSLQKASMSAMPDP